MKHNPMEYKEEQCCCNCKNQLKLRCHPWNKEFGKGSIMEQCGWVCVVALEMDGELFAQYSDREHGMCELWTKRKNDESNPDNK